MVNGEEIAVAAESEDPVIQQAAATLARELRLQYVGHATPQSAGLLLVLNDSHLELRDAKARGQRGVFVDFSTLHPKQAARRGGFSPNQPLARAIGKSSKSVLDATAGLGHDAALLACLGYQVIAMERSPIIAALLRDGLRRALEDDLLREYLVDRLQIVNADARHALSGDSIKPDAVYIDPMFPPKRKASALAKKSIRLVRRIVGDDEDAGELLAMARQRALRVVVKRPTHAPPLAESPTMSMTGKLVRYDIYVAKRPVEMQPH